MKNRGMAGLVAAIGLILVIILGSGCAGSKQIAQEQVGTEYLLQQAGFRKWQINQNMPQQEALLSTLPKRTLVNYQRDGEKLHAYGDKDTRTLYIGDEAAYQRYLALAQGKEGCEQQVGGGESAKFWGCMDEYRQRGGRQPGK